MAFFFSSRRRHTRYIGDWSSDVCSSDLAVRARQPAIVVAEHVLALVGRQLLDECAPGFRKHARHAVHEPVDFAEGGEKYTAKHEAQYAIRVRLRVQQRQRRPPRTAEQQPLVDAKMLAQPLDVLDKMRSRVVAKLRDRRRSA